MALAHHRPPLDGDDFLGERLLALAVLHRAVEDLQNQHQRAGAQRFLLSLRGTLWASWWPELNLARDVGALVARKTAHPPTRTGLVRKRGSLSPSETA